MRLLADPFLDGSHILPLSLIRFWYGNSRFILRHQEVYFFLLTESSPHFS